MRGHFFVGESVENSGRYADREPEPEIDAFVARFMNELAEGATSPPGDSEPVFRWCGDSRSRTGGSCVEVVTATLCPITFDPKSGVKAEITEFQKDPQGPWFVWPIEKLAVKRPIPWNSREIRPFAPAEFDANGLLDYKGLGHDELFDLAMMFGPLGRNTCSVQVDRSQVLRHGRKLVQGAGKVQVTGGSTREPVASDWLPWGYYYAERIEDWQNVVRRLALIDELVYALRPRTTGQKFSGGRRKVTGWPGSNAWLARLLNQDWIDSNVGLWDSHLLRGVEARTDVRRDTIIADREARVEELRLARQQDLLRGTSHYQPDPFDQQLAKQIVYDFWARSGQAPSLESVAKEMVHTRLSQELASGSLPGLSTIEPRIVTLPIDLQGFLYALLASKHIGAFPEVRVCSRNGCYNPATPKSKYCSRSCGQRASRENGDHPERLEKYRAQARKRAQKGRERRAQKS